MMTFNNRNRFPRFDPFNLLTFSSFVLPMSLPRLLRHHVAVNRLTEYSTADELQVGCVNTKRLRRTWVMKFCGIEMHLLRGTSIKAIVLENINLSARKGEL